MEQHPVPQNVTTFQFRLIGDMTLKQFGYLCAGAILAFIAYKLPLPFFFTWPLAFGFAFLGVGFAFIPIEERPMDVWVFSFFKSIYNPTQYVWTKTAPPPEPAHKTPPAKPVSTPPAQTTMTVPAPPPPQQTTAVPPQPASNAGTEKAVPVSKSASVLSGLFQKNHPVPAQPQNAPQPMTHAAPAPKRHGFSLFAWLTQLWSPNPAAHSAPIPAAAATVTRAFPAPSVRPAQSTPALKKEPPAAPIKSVTGHKPEMPKEPEQPSPVRPEKEALEAKEKMEQLESSLRNLQSQLATKNVASDRILELQKQLTEVLQQKSQMENELVTLKRRLESDDGKGRATSEPAAQNESTAKSTVTVINTQDAAVKVGLPKLTNYPNVITGIVKDNGGNLLPGILVTVVNKENIPVRALKTNKLGQFAASTQLGSGTYFVEIEDPRKRFTFSRVQITLSGNVVPALEIIAKSQKQLTREKLTQEIFGQNTI